MKGVPVQRGETSMSDPRGDPFLQRVFSPNRGNGFYALNFVVHF
jgi:hypothetical protein